MGSISINKSTVSEEDRDYNKGIRHLKMVSDQVSEIENPLHAKYPKNLMVEVTNSCNLKCIMCYSRNMIRPKGFMSLDTYKLILNSAKELETIEMVGLYTTGEAFLHPHIFDFIKHAKDMGFRYVYITTNGVLLNEKSINKIFESGLDSIKFSIDAADKKTYESVRVGGNFDVLYRNIKMLREMRDAKKSNLKIYGSFVLTNKNREDLTKFKEFWKNLVDEVVIYIVMNQAGHQIKEFEELVPDEVKPLLENKGDTHCNRLWNRIVVTYDGKYTICPEDFEAEITYGDIHKESMKDSWNSERMKKYRSMFKTRDFSQSPNCGVCNTYLTDSLIIDESG